MGKVVVPQKRAKINPKQIQKDYRDRAEKLEQEMIKDGVPMFDTKTLNINSEYLILPREITETPSRELGEYLNAFTQQKMYVRTLLSRASMYVEEARSEYFESSKSSYRQLSTGKFSETAKERILATSDESKDTYETYSWYLAKQKTLEGVIANLEDAIFMLSREISRRVDEFGDQNREHNRLAR